ncbi:MAG: hypothetical protein AVDCRST_MAG68-5 [uncultured Gemmatimonadetes bacterium]|uniref:Uncharacterized protein n=1 Tax=uncultured Gemmatimonadota bacterium TaxID=203437 RepID=A0A6J4K5Q5_9BACT|nr:MAG: hypothetical protein AVDCRST_MAG68-5 [uncultured Gemmatimonadota bacterium]
MPERWPTWELTVAVFLIFMVPAGILGNLSWSRITAAVRGSGRAYPPIIGSLSIILQFIAVIREEQDPEKKREYKALLRRFALSTAPALAWVGYVLYMMKTLSAR